MLFKLKKGAGPHSENGKIYKAGEVIESDLDLIKLFPRKFQRLDIDNDNEVSTNPLGPLIPMSSEIAEVPLDSEVTEDFKIPEGKSFKVFSPVKGWCIVRTNDDPATDEKLRTSSVQTFLDLS